MQDYQISTSPPVVDALINPRVTSSTGMYPCTGWTVDGPVVPVSPGLARLRPYPPSCHRRQ